jgi:hypothetical protein
MSNNTRKIFAQVIARSRFLARTPKRFAPLVEKMVAFGKKNAEINDGKKDVRILFGAHRVSQKKTLHVVAAVCANCFECFFVV